MRTLLLSAAALAALSTPALAQEAPSDLVSPVIISTRLPSLADDQPAVTVFTASQIQQRQANTAFDLLQTAPGLSIYRTGAFGGVTTVRQRGMTNDKTLVLVDGVPQNDASQPSGGFDFARLSLDEVSQIEVLSGPQGSLWGSDAIGGVIAFTTRPTNGLSLRAEAASYGTVDGAISLGRVTDGWNAGVYASGIRTDGISAADERAGNGEKDGYRNTVVGLRGATTLGQVKLDGRVEYDRSDLDTDGYTFNPLTFVSKLEDTNDGVKTRGWNGFGRAVAPAGGFDHTVSLGVSSFDRDYSGISGAYGYKAQNRVLRYTAQHGGPDDRLSVTAGAEREEVRANLSSGTRSDLSANSAFVVARGKAGPAVVTGSLRYDDPDRFDSAATGKLAAAVGIGGGWRLLASVGQGFKTPSISQAVCDFCFAPAVPLRPEKADGYDLGADWRSASGRLSLGLDAYSLQVKDQIDYVASRYINISRVESRGLDLTARAILGAGFDLRLTWSTINAKDKSTSLRLRRVPAKTASAVLGYSQGPWSGALTVRGESSQRDTAIDGFTDARRKGFTVADLAGSYALSDTVSLTARVGNLTDRHFQEVIGFGEPGRNVSVGLRLRR